MRSSSSDRSAASPRGVPISTSNSGLPCPTVRRYPLANVKAHGIPGSGPSSVCMCLASARSCVVPVHGGVLTIVASMCVSPSARVAIQPASRQRGQAIEIAGGLAEKAGERGIAELIVAQEANLAIPGVGQIGKVGAVEKALRPHLKHTPGPGVWEVVGQDHRGIEPEIIIALEQRSVDVKLVNPQVGNTESQLRI